MVTQYRVHLQTWVLLIFGVHLSRPVCVEVPSRTEAVLGRDMRLTCISCMKREEVKPKTIVEWYYRPNKDENTELNRTLIYLFADSTGKDQGGPFKGRLRWNGSQDLQDISIIITNVTCNDSGYYECHVRRDFVFGFFNPSFFLIKNITLKVKRKATPDSAAIYSEIMMYVLLVFLTFWLLVEMVYCYRKISKSDEQAQDTTTNYLAIPSEQKDIPAAPVTE